jgi:hypothetical protein
MFGTKELPDELKGLNLSPAQILEKLKERDDLEKKSKEFQDAGQQALQLAKDKDAELNTLKSKLAELEANPPRRTEPSNNNNNADADIEFLSDPEGAVAQRIKRGVQPVAFVALNAARNAAKMSARLTLSRQSITFPDGKANCASLFDKWGTEIEKAAEQIPIVNLGNEVTWINLFNYIKGNHLEEMMSKPSDFLEPVASNANVSVGDEKRPEKLNDEQADIAKKMSRYGKGVTAEKILETRKKMSFVNVE